MKLLTKLKNNFIIVKKRWISKSPSFFKKLKKYSIVIGGSAIAMITANTSMNLGLDLTWLSYIIVLCVGIAGTSQLTKD